MGKFKHEEPFKVRSLNSGKIYWGENGFMGVGELIADNEAFKAELKENCPNPVRCEVVVWSANETDYHTIDFYDESVLKYGHFNSIRSKTYPNEYAY